MTQHWLTVSREELDELYESAFAAMREDWDKQPRAMRHFMNGVLFFQLGVLRDAVKENYISGEQAERAMLGDRCLGYLFGLAANYVDSCNLPRQSPEAQTAMFDIHQFTFGHAEGSRIADEQSHRHDLDPTFEIGMERAHKDANSFKRVLNGKEAAPYAGLIEQIYAATAENGTRNDTG